MSLSAVVVSDVHRNDEFLRQLLPIINASDYFIFCGDGISDVMSVSCEITARMVCARGNCDYGSMVSESSRITLGSVGAFVTHGHLYGVKQSLGTLAEIARAKDCDVAFFGHTHIFTDIEIGGVRLINPGALAGGSYAFVKIDGKKITCEQRCV